MSARKMDGNKQYRYELIPAGPLHEVARCYGVGARKYGDDNWRAGLNWSRLFGSMMRHAWAWFRGESHDPENGQHHLAAVVFCCLSLMEYEGTHPELDDRVKPLREE